MKAIHSLILGTVLSLGSLYAASYKVDTVHSTIEFKVRHMMVSNTKGVFEKFSGHYNYDAKTKQISSLVGTVDINSVNTREAKRDAHLKKDDFFDLAKYPTMSLKLVKHQGDKVILDLTIKETTKRVTFNVDDLSSESKDPWGNYRTGFVITGKINRKDYGLSFNKVLDTGGIAVGNEVKITMELAGIKK